MQSVLHGVHAQGHVHSGAVREEGSQSGFNQQAEDEDSVPVEEETRARQRQADASMCRRSRLNSVQDTKNRLLLKDLPSFSFLSLFILDPPHSSCLRFSYPAHTYFMPCWKREFLLVLQMMRSAHWTTTMLTKKAVWQVNSMIFLCS